MKFSHPTDTKAFLLGVCASITAVILWDIIKNRTKIHTAIGKGYITPIKCIVCFILVCYRISSTIEE